MKYYYPEHIEGYQRIKAEGKAAWNEIHGESGFENFSSRLFLEMILPKLEFSVPNPTALECGCGTGPGACFLAERGFQVTGIDLIPTAIELARKIAQERNMEICYEVMDVCSIPHDGKKFDMIVDSYCLQGIVLAEDRRRVFESVRARLKPGGYYLVSTAMFHDYAFTEERVKDDETGIIYNRYGDSALINMQTNIVYEILEGDPDDYEDAVKITGIWHLPNRRHWKPSDLRKELELAGFEVLYQGGEEGGNTVCVLQNGLRKDKT